MSDIESGTKKPTLETALRAQVWSENEILASDLRPDLRDVIEAFEIVAHRRLSTAQAAEVLA